MLFVIAAACTDSTDTAKPTTIEFTSVSVQGAVAGQALTSVPAIVVKDQNGSPLANVSITVTVTAGGGTLTAPPQKTVAGPTPIGTWTLGPRVGTNTISVTAGNLTPVTFSVESAAGAPAKFNASSTSINGVVGSPALPAPSATLVDANNNAIAGVPVTLSVTGGGQATATPVTDALGTVTVTGWTLGTVKGNNTLTLTAGSVSITFTAAAKAGPVTSLVVVSGNNQSVPAGSVTEPIVLRATDRFNNGIDNQGVSVFVTAGAGALPTSTATADANGTINVSGWTLGKSVVPQSIRITADGLAADIDATVRTDYNIQVRFFGPEMPPEQRAMFENAAARLSAIITGDVADINAVNFNVASACGVSAAPLTETIDDVIIYATIGTIDGSGNILGQASPCAFRPAGLRNLPAIGFMRFDVADVDFMITNNLLQEVITHEMLHVLGVGATLWNANGYLVNFGTASVAFTGPLAKQGCQDAGGVLTCANSVPVENTGGPGTAGTHWRESVFGNELMTGYANFPPSPLSMVTIGSLADIGYTINSNAADQFRPSTLSIRTTPPIMLDPNWENSGTAKPVIIHPNGTIEQLPPAMGDLIRLR
jgi:hypothetical protein